MKRARGRVGIALALLAFAIPARAETIQITSGALVWTGPGAPHQVSLAGQGFTFGGLGLEGIFMPVLDCLQCAPGSTVNLLARWVGLDLPGTATLNGQTFTGVGGLNSTTSLDAVWTGSLTIPQDFGGGMLAAPFAFNAGFFVSGTEIDLEGMGTASLSFAAFPGLAGALRVTSAAYQFNGESTVPEPMSMVLVGTGLAGLAALRRRHNTRR